jgi:hypothetical protein
MNILHQIKVSQDNLIDHILRIKYLLKHVIEAKIDGRIEVTRRRERRRRQLLHNITETEDAGN